MFENYRDTIQPHYDFLASFWDRLTGNVNYSEAFRFIDEVRQRLGLEKRILDVLCGTGTLLSFFEEQGYVTYGVDVSRNMLAEARKKLKKTKLFEGDYHFIPIQEHFPVLVNHYNSFQHIVSKTEFVSVLKYLKTKLTPNGILVFDLIPRMIDEGEKFCVNKVETPSRFLSLTRYEFPYESFIFQKNLYSIFHRKSKIFEVREIDSILGAFTRDDILEVIREAEYYLLEFDDLVPYSENVFVIQNVA